MDSFALPLDEVVPLDQVADDVRALRIIFVNVFGIRTPAGWVLVDAGLPLSAPLIRNWAHQTFGAPPLAILLTHGHFDHVGAVQTLAAEWRVPVFAHDAEAPFLTGRQSYAPPDLHAGGGAMTWLSPLYPREPIDLQPHLRLLGTGLDVSRLLPGWQVVHTPGHTPGHISLWRAQDGTLLVGDAFCTTKPEAFFSSAVAQQPELHGPPAYFTPDWAGAHASVQRLAALRPQTVAPGHGKPLRGAEVAPALERLAQNFHQLSAR